MEFDGSRISISNNQITFLGSDWFQSHQWHHFDMFNNTFGSFDKLTLEDPTSTIENVQCLFNRNLFTKVQEGVFKSVSSACQFRELLFKQPCSCSFTWLENLFRKSKTYKQYISESYCSINRNDSFSQCLNTDLIRLDHYHEEMCSHKKSNARKKCDKMKKVNFDAKFIDAKELSSDFEWMDNIYFYAIAVISAFLVLCILIAISVRPRTRDTTRNFNDRSNHQAELFNLSEGPPSYEASLRTTKMFSNHDLNIINRTLELMKVKQPNEKYESVYKNTKHLLEYRLNEYEKVKVIGDIVQTISECDNSGEDFVAFTDILFTHLAPDRVTALEVPASRTLDHAEGHYAEPNASQPERNIPKTNTFHIYAEPTALNMQQTRVPLLLANKYSNPLDVTERNYQYSEPVVQRSGETHIYFI